MNDELRVRKLNTYKVLDELDIPYDKDLNYPMKLESEVNKRDKEEIARRAIASLMAIQVACDILNESDLEQSRKTFVGLTEKTYQVKNDLTKDEKEVLYGNPTNELAASTSWKYEAYWTLLWALELVPTLEYPSDICDCMHAIDIVRSQENLKDFIMTSGLRSIKEILNEQDINYRYYLLCEEARNNGEEDPEYLDFRIIKERHLAFKWLLGKNTEDDNWDLIKVE
ncbi:conserved hypothetical protein [Alteracholeplasma palmae J233]|uniref:DUF4272 domain-containing protein n=1 Tax=Alteracholeplasma palmae (strain ATCC 49389 / J233) TaxID=1318466 RepID=U4KJK8_ALTPJ|nr:DUF4272 domain-containing protein [Alteracholeplasma palmae]CCV63689.1 conserved hypothetical protein [Alteracholeplasma palmae J233]